MLSNVLATAFAAVSSDGDRASDGVSAACAERMGVFAIAAAIDERVHGERVASRKTRDRSALDEHDTDDVADEQHALAGIAVGEHAGERRDEPRGNEASRRRTPTAASPPIPYA